MAAIKAREEGRTLSSKAALLSANDVPSLRARVEALEAALREIADVMRRAGDHETEDIARAALEGK